MKSQQGFEEGNAGNLSRRTKRKLLTLLQKKRKRSAHFLDFMVKQFLFFFLFSESSSGKWRGAVSVRLCELSLHSSSWPVLLLTRLFFVVKLFKLWELPNESATSQNKNKRLTRILDADWSSEAEYYRLWNLRSLQLLTKLTHISFCVCFFGMKQQYE